MNAARLACPVVCGLALALGMAACGSSKPKGGAASSEAKSAATGDIPDNQVFLTFKNAAGRYSISYPEGWARKGSGGDVTFQDKDNRIHVVVEHGTSAPAPPGRVTKPTHAVTLHGLHVKALTYATQSPPNPVTGKSVALTTDRYVYPAGGHVIVVDLASPVGVDNVDAYRMISESFRAQ